MALFAGQGLAQEAKPPAHPTEKQDIGQGERPKPQEPIADAAIGITETVDPNAGQTSAENGNTNAEQELRDIAKRDLAAQQIMAKFTRQMALATWAAVAITALGVWLIWRTLIHTRRAAKAAEDAVIEAQNATKAGQDAAEAARRQADAAIRLEAAKLIIEEAFITPKHGGAIQEDGMPVDGHVVRLELRNIGKTHAEIKRYCICCKVDDLPPDTRYPIFAQRAALHGTLIAPGNRLHVDGSAMPILISDEDADAIRGRRKHLWAYGYVRFDDWFGIERTEEFLLRWKTGPWPNERQPYITGFIPHDRDAAYQQPDP